MSFKYSAAAAAAALLIGIALGRFAAPTKVVTRTEIQQVTQVTDHSVITRTRQPNGSVVTIIKKDVEDVSKSDTTALKEVTRAAPRWLISGIVGTEIGGSLGAFSPSYGASVQYRIGGPFFMGGQAIKLGNGVFAGASFGLEL